MATVQDIVTRAMRLAGIIEAGETPSAADAADGTVVFNHMLSGWAKMGVDLGHTTLAASATIPLHDSFLEGVTYNLAARLGVEWGSPIPQAVIAHAGATFAAFQAHVFEYEDDLAVDSALQPQHFDRRTGGYDIEKG